MKKKKIKSAGGEPEIISSTSSLDEDFNYRKSQEEDTWEETDTQFFSHFLKQDRFNMVMSVLKDLFDEK